VLPAMTRRLPGEPSCKAPPPASEPISTGPTFPIASVAPLLTLKSGMNDDVLVLLTVNVALF
jgi:hypothetical protein